MSSLLLLHSVIMEKDHYDIFFIKIIREKISNEFFIQHSTGVFFISCFVISKFISHSRMSSNHFQNTQTSAHNFDGSVPVFINCL